MKEEKLLQELIDKKNELEKRIQKGREIIENKKKLERQNLISEAKSKIDKELWNIWLLKLLKEMEFEGIFYGDLVSIGVEGKRPFGNSDSSGDIARILGWECEDDLEDDLSDNQYCLIQAIWKDLPDFINNLIKSL